MTEGHLSTAVLGSSDGSRTLFIGLDVPIGSPRPPRIPADVRVVGEPRAYLGGHSEALADAGQDHFRWALATVVDADVLERLLSALTTWLGRPLRELAGETFEQATDLGDDVDAVRVSFGAAGPERVQSSVGITTCRVVWRSFPANADFAWNVDITVLEAFRVSLADALNRDAHEYI